MPRDRSETREEASAATYARHLQVHSKVSKAEEGMPRGLENCHESISALRTDKVPSENLEGSHGSLNGRWRC